MAAGVSLVVIGQGDATRAEAFRREMSLPFPVYGDPERGAYRAYGLVEGSAGQLAGGGVLVGAARALLSGSLPGAYTGGGRQLPGAFVIDRDGVVRFSHPAKHAADSPSATALLAAAGSFPAPSPAG